MLHTTERPLDFDSVKGQNDVVKNLRNQSIRNMFSPFYIFEGNKGSGKTTLARIIARAANCTNKDEHGNPCCKCKSCKSILNGTSMDYIELDGASNNGVEQARSIIEGANYVPAMLKKKVIVIDEAHMLSNGAFNAFLKTLKEPPEYCIFIMATTELHKIPETVRSRAMIYTFNRIESNVIVDHLKEVAKKYNVTLEDDAAALIAKKARGAMRDALGELEKCLLIGDVITAKDVMQASGIEDTEILVSLVSALCRYQRAEVFQQIDNFYQKGRDMKYVIDEILSIFTDVIRCKNTDSSFIINTKEYIQSIEKISGETTNNRLSFLSGKLMDLKKDLRIDPGRNNVLVSMSKMCDMAADPNAYEERISKLERLVDALTSGKAIDISNVEKPKTVSNEETKYQTEQVKKSEKKETAPKKHSTKETAGTGIPVVAGISKGEDGSFGFDEKPSVPVSQKTENVAEDKKEEKPTAQAILGVAGAASDTVHETKEESNGISNVLFSVLGVPGASKGNTAQKGVDLVSEKPQKQKKQEQEYDGFVSITETADVPFEMEQEEPSAMDTLLSDEIIRTAVNECSWEGDEGILYTRYMPVKNIIEAYIDARGLSGQMQVKVV